jgi:hypothetical protein
VFGRIREATPLISQSTKSTPNLGSTIASGIPEVTTGGRAEVGALIGGIKGTGNPPPQLLHQRVQTDMRATARSQSKSIGTRLLCCVDRQTSTVTDGSTREPGWAWQRDSAQAPLLLRSPARG